MTKPPNPNAKPRPVVTHTVRTKDGLTKSLRMTRNLAIKLHCTECMGDNHPSTCTSLLCPLYPYRGQTRASQKGDRK